MSRSANKVVGITIGDPAGIGPEVTAKALSKVVSGARARFLVITDETSYKKYFFSLRKGIDYCIVPSNNRNGYSSGKPTAHSAQLALKFLEQAVVLLKDKSIQALVTAPLAKEYVDALHPGFLGHTEYLANAFRVKKFDMMFVADQLKTVIVTRHVSIKDVPKLITRQKVFDTIALVDRSLRGQFKIKHPRIAVCGLNPHAGEGGKFGREEIESIIPAIKGAARKGINVSGPLSGDTMFVPKKRGAFDAVVCMFHDQGLIAPKALYFDSVVNLTIGLPFVRTSPAHGTAFDIAGKNKADASSMLCAVELALKLSSFKF